MVDILVPPSVKQAKWLIVGGVLMLAIGVARAVTFFSHGGLMFLLLAALFVSVGIATLIGSVTRIRRGDPPSSGGAETTGARRSDGTG